MARVFHIVGIQGSGKSAHAVALGKQFEAQGLKCAGMNDPESEFINTRTQAINRWPDADVIFVEYLQGPPPEVAPGDIVVTLELVSRHSQ